MSRLRANQITNQATDGAPTVEKGLVISGVTTSTSFSGSGTSLTNLPSAQLTGALPAIDGSNLTGLSTPLSFRNLIINGQFLIWQRATDSGSNTTDGYLSCDRWFHASSGATKQVTRQAFTLGQTDVPDNPKYYLRYAVTTGNNNVALRQRIEDVTRVQGEMTFSFWVKGSNPGGGQFDLIFRQNFGTGGSPSNVVDTGIANYTVSNTWTKKTFTFTPASLSGKTIGTTENTSYYEIELFRQPDGDTSTAAFTVDFANIQLERGSEATTFEQRSFGEELVRCHRYYQQYTNIMSHGYVPDNGSRSYSHAFTFPVEMRAAPTLTLSNTGSSGGQYVSDGNTIKNITTLNSAANNTKNSEWYPFLSGDLANFRGAYTLSLNSTTYQTTFKFNAEL